MNRYFTVVALVLSVLVGCGGDDGQPTPTPPTTGGTPNTPQKCDATNCAGCCFNNTCQVGTTASACGKKGAACVACGASVQVCKTDQTCGVDPDGVWRVQPVSAQIASNNNGSAWDGDGSAPDVFLAMLCPGSTTATYTPEAQGYTPAWTTGGCTAKASQLLAEQWVFQVWDGDISSHDTITGGLGFKFTEEAFTAGTVTLGPSGGLTSLRVQLQKQP